MAESWYDDVVGDEEFEGQAMEDEPEVSPATLDFSESSAEVQATDRRDSTVFDLRSKRWHEQQASSGLSFGNEVQAALDNAPELVASRLAPRTKKLYNEKYQLLVNFAATMDPPVIVNIEHEPAPPQVIIAFFRAMSYGKMVEVKDKHGVPIRTSNGTSRVGRGWGYDTFRSSFHALKTVHRIFYGDICYEVINGKAIGNPLMCAEVIEVYHSILRGLTRQDFCSSHGREVVLPESARRFSVSDLIKINQYVMHHASEENIRNWTYILLSIGLFLRQDEAANLVLSDISLARNPSTERPLLTDDGLPHCLVVMIIRDKTNKDGPGRRLYLRRNEKNRGLCPVIATMMWLSILREKHSYRRGHVFTSLRRGQLGCKLSAPHFLQIVKGLTKGAGLPHWNEYGTHSMRHSAAYFASWIGIPPETIRILGRWNSTVYFTYVKSADKDKRDWMSLNVENAGDPVEQNMDIFGSARTNH